MNDLWPWLALLGLGAFHGINPAMGWLFAVALGLQQKDRNAVFRALPAIALGHALSITIIVGIVLLARISLSHIALKLTAAAILFTFGFLRLWRPRHPKWVGMQVGFRDLTLWSFIMASAHGAGLMLIPLFLARKQPPPLLASAQIGPGLNIEPFCGIGFSSFSTPSILAGSVAIHTLGHLIVTGLLALLVYEKLGVSILRRAWFNLDLIWMLALIATGVFILAF